MKTLDKVIIAVGSISLAVLGLMVVAGTGLFLATRIDVANQRHAEREAERVAYAQEPSTEKEEAPRMEDITITEINWGSPYGGTLTYEGDLAGTRLVEFSLDVTGAGETYFIGSDEEAIDYYRAEFNEALRKDLE